MIPETIKIDNTEYVRKDSINTQAEKLDGMEYCIIRTYSAGVFAGYVKAKEGQEVVLIHARRLYVWDGAATLSQLAMEGVSKPQNCKFPCEVDNVRLLQAIEIIKCTEQSRKSIAGVAIWKA